MGGLLIAMAGESVNLPTSTPESQSRLTGLMSKWQLPTPDGTSSCGGYGCKLLLYSYLHPIDKHRFTPGTDFATVRSRPGRLLPCDDA